MIRDLKRFSQETNTPDFQEIDMVYEIDNKYLLLLSIDGQHLSTLSQLSDAWNSTRGGEGSVVIITKPPRTSVNGTYNARELEVEYLYKNGKKTPVKGYMDLLGYVRKFAAHHKIQKLFGI